MTPSERIKQLEDAIGVVIAASTSATPDYFTVPTEEMGELARVADGDISPPATPEAAGEKTLRQHMEFIACQPCERVAEDSVDDLDACKHSGDCMTEYCLPCYARAALAFAPPSPPPTPAPANASPADSLRPNDRHGQVAPAVPPASAIRVHKPDPELDQDYPLYLDRKQDEPASATPVGELAKELRRLMSDTAAATVDKVYVEARQWKWVRQNVEAIAAALDELDAVRRELADAKDQSSGWRREADRLRLIARDAEDRAADAEKWKDLLRRIDKRFGCEHVEHGPEDAEALVRHVDEVIAERDAARQQRDELRAELKSHPCACQWLDDVLSRQDGEGKA